MLPLLLALVLAVTPDSGLLARREALPALRGTYLSGEDARLPADAGGRVALLALGFSYASRFPVEAWTKRFRERFASDSLVTSYEIPMLGGMARLARPFIDGGMRRGTPLALQRNVITVYGDTGPWKKLLQVKNRDVAYLVLIDPSGRVTWTHRGEFDEEGFARLEREVERLRAESPP